MRTLDVLMTSTWAHTCLSVPSLTLLPICFVPKPTLVVPVSSHLPFPRPSGNLGDPQLRLEHAFTELSYAPPLGQSAPGLQITHHKPGLFRYPRPTLHCFGLCLLKSSLHGLPRIDHIWFVSTQSNFSSPHKPLGLSRLTTEVFYRLQSKILPRSEKMCWLSVSTT
jgi:hypothetical protein